MPKARFAIVFAMLCLLTLPGSVGSAGATHLLDEADDEASLYGGYGDDGGFAIPSIGVCGQGSAEATLAFIDAGYDAVDLGPDTRTPQPAPDGQVMRFVAFVGGVDVDQSRQYAMEVMDMRTSQSLWAGEGPYGLDDALTQNDERIGHAVASMLRDFSQAYPPARRRHPG